MAVVPPPNNQTVINTIKSVVEKTMCSTGVQVSLIASVNAIAPLNPEKYFILGLYLSIAFLKSEKDIFIYLAL